MIKFKTTEINQLSKGDRLKTGSDRKGNKIDSVESKHLRYQSSMDENVCSACEEMDYKV